MGVSAGSWPDSRETPRWQVLEERVGGVTKASYVWSPVYVDALVSRDRDADGVAANGLEERLYALADANYNVTALVSVAGVVVERYAYDPFGKASVLDAGFAAKAGGTGYGWVVLFQGLRRDNVSGLDDARNRDYSAMLGRWVTMDPIGFDGRDSNLHRAFGNTPVCVVDPSGQLFWIPVIIIGVILIGSSGCTRSTPAPVPPTAPPSKLPVTYTPGFWNDGGKVQKKNNCYSYACNDYGPHISDSTSGKPQPGMSSGKMYTDLTCENITAAAISDGLTRVIASGGCAAGKRSRPQSGCSLCENKRLVHYLPARVSE